MLKHIQIRKAKQEDAKALAGLLFLAMEDIIYHFIGVEKEEEAIRFLHHFTQRKNNQYSFENCYVAEVEEEIVAAINIYDGAKLKGLRFPIENYIDQHYKSNYILENETEAGEYYIDSIAVRADLRGSGVGTKLLKHTINIYSSKNRQTIGLLVECTNPDAKRLYLKLGFIVVGTKILAGKKLEHLMREEVKT
ncbi:Acetyltransferase (GNAT) family protein [Flavobacteriaceae bacterium MAR_2010_188]|nr:Acetyltransferase (GNAT) family protein [Flavobacteriaceae bacterium MAR_2010_188]